MLYFEKLFGRCQRMSRSRMEGPSIHGPKPKEKLFQMGKDGKEG